ncbi:MAG TPA: CocE/NonD family hydrolase [Solirubrobacteraceae bacterium]|jgi:predicted acyl esterase
MGASGRVRSAATAAACAAALWAAPTATAATDPATFGPCLPYGDQQICTAEVPSFDATQLDVDLTRPLNADDGTRHPLIVMLHGFGNDKHEWESLTDEGDGADKRHWNSHWFAKHGYYVLTYTVRGHRTDEASGTQPPTPAGTSVSEPDGKIRLKSREFEVRDTQYLAALVADAFPDVDPHRVAVTGGSYGGGESWLQASQAEWTWAHEEFGLPALSLQVAIPKYPWTDLAYALAPNGHPGPEGVPGDPIYESSQGAADSPTGTGNPIGVPKASYITGLFATGQAAGLYEDGASNQDTSEEGPINVESWITRILAGDPYEPSDPIVAEIRRGLTEFRSAYYQDEGWAAQRTGRKVAIFSIQGWTDDLFPAVESFRMFKYLKRLDPRWPVAVEVADIGHARGQNKPETWRRLNAQAFQFLQANINGSHDQQTTVASQPTLCPNDGEPDSNETAAMRLTATSPEGLSNGRLTVAFPGGALNNTSGLADPNGPKTDPVLGGFFDSALPGAGGPCRSSASPAVSAYTAVSQPLPSATTYIGLGSVALPYTFTGLTATVNARVWDVAPDGTTLLMTRGTYRVQPPYDASAGTVRLPLFGNHWPLRPGHRVRLDLAEVDAGTFRPTNPTNPNSFAFENATLVLPTREAGARRLAGTVTP